MIEVKAVKNEVTEGDLLSFYAENANRIKPIQNMLRDWRDSLEDQWKEPKDIRISIDPDEIYITVNDVMLFHTERTWTAKSKEK